MKKKKQTKGKTGKTVTEQSIEQSQQSEKPWQFKPGQSGNPNGRPVGSQSFSTKWKIFIDKVAAQNNMTPQEIDEQLFSIGFKKAKEGDYRFYQDLHDRLYGKPKQVTELTGLDGKDLIPENDEKLDKLTALLNDIHKKPVHKGRSVSSNGETSNAVGT